VHINVYKVAETFTALSLSGSMAVLVDGADIDEEPRR
jgi:hypothetical protein